MTVKEMIVMLLDYPMEWNLLLYEYDERGGDYYPATELRPGEYSEGGGEFRSKILNPNEPEDSFNALLIE